MSRMGLHFITFLFTLVFFSPRASQALGSDPEMEPNNSLQNAQTLNPGQVIQAALDSSTDKDFFALTISRESLVTLSFRALPPPSEPTTSLPTQASVNLPQDGKNSEEVPEPSGLEVPNSTTAEPSLPSTIGLDQAVEGLVGALFGDTSRFPWRWRVSLSSAPTPYQAVDKVDFFFGARNDTSLPQERTIGLKPGLYLIQVGPIMDLPWVRNRIWSDQPYEIGVSVTPASPDRNEIEPNNTFSSAQRIMIGKQISGNLTGSADKDIFRFEVNQPGYVELHFSHDPLPAQDCTWQIDLFLLHGGDLEPIESLCSPGNTDSLERTLLLDPGEYALEIHAPEASVYSSKGYVFSLNPWQP